MNTILLGTGAAWPDADRSAPAFLLQHEGMNFLIDCGGGASHQLMKIGVPPSSLEYIFLTHTHIDHCVEFPSLVFGAYLTGKEGNFFVFGPKGTDHFCTSIFNDTYSFAQPMMKKLRNKEISIITKEVEKGIIFKEKGIVIETTPVKHGFPTLAYKFTTNSKSVVFSGDTAPCETLVEISKNADLLVIENSFPEEVGRKPGHCIPSQVAEIARECSVKKVLLVHLFPNCKGKEESIIKEIQKGFGGEVEIGYDLQQISID